MLPMVIGGVAILLLLGGVGLLVVSLLGGSKDGGTQFSLFPSATPTVTNTATATPVTPTLTPTLTETVTPSPTITMTNTPNGPFEYTVLEKDTCWDIAVKFKVDLDTLLFLNKFQPGQCPISASQKIMIPAPGQTLPTATNVPATYRGKIVYRVQTGDSLAFIAAKFNSTTDAIIKENDKPERGANRLSDINKIFVGQELIIPANITTPTATRGATSTSVPSTPGATSVPVTPTTAATVAPATMVPSNTPKP
jgi:LysM repeat protein